MVAETAYEDILLTTNFTGGAGESTLPAITGDSRTVVTESSGKWQFSYLTLSSSDFSALLSGGTYYTTADREYNYLPAGGDPELSTNQMTIVDSVLNSASDAYAVSFENVANVNFSAGTTSTAQIVIGQTTNNADVTSGVGGYTLDYSASMTNPDKHGDIWLNQDALNAGNSYWDSESTEKGSVGYLTVMHELGHALGLNHTTNPDGSSIIDNGVNIDSQQYSIMSYNLMAGEDVAGPDNEITPFGLQILDIAAIQAIYGRNYDERSTATVYSSATAFASDRPNNGFIYTIWDGGGTDVIDATGFSHHALIDLRQGNFSSIGNAADTSFNPGTVNGFAYDEGQAENNVAIAFHTVIENAIGTAYDDTLVGNDWNNVLYGANGNDQIYGSGVPYDGQTGFKTVDPNDSSDPNSSVPSTQHDVLIGGNGDDILYGGLGSDVLDGGYNKSDIDSAASGWDSAGEITGTNNYNGTAYSNIPVADDGNDTADYSNLPLGTSHTGIDVTFSSSVDYGTVSKGVSGALGTDKLFSIEIVIGTSHNDTFTGANGATLAYSGGAGSDQYNFNMASDTGIVSITEPAASGVDTITVNGADMVSFVGYSDSGGHETMAIDFLSDWNSSTSTYNNLLELIFDTSSLGDGYGIENLQLDSQILRATDIYQWLTGYPSMSPSDLYQSVGSYASGGTGGTGAGGGTLPTYDGSGNVTSMQISPAVGGSPISYAFADVVDNPMVLTSFSESYSGGTYTSTAGWATYEQAFDFVGGITSGDVRLTLSGSQGSGALTINIDSLDFSLTISNFETGQTINGIEVYNSTLHGIIQDASGSTLVSTGTNTFGGSYLTLTGMGVDTSDTVTEHYYLEALNFVSGSGIDLTAPITFTGSDSDETLTGLDGRADIIYGMGGNDHIYGYGGDDTLIGGAGNDQLYGGTGNDTYVFAAGWGSDTVHESLSSGTDTINFSGIAPSDIRMYTDSSGYLHLVQISDPTNTVTIIAGITGVNSDESTAGSYVEQVTFDSSYGTTWDLTGGLNITGDNVGDSLYGTAYNDVITGGTGVDYIYGNAGDDTIIGGTGNDHLYGGPGNDTYVFSPGFGNDTVNESLSAGTDTIHLSGIDPADVRLYTDSSGYLHIVDTTNPSYNITVVAGITGANTYESKIGLYVESITFDSTYGTTWDLTGGLNITGDNSGDSLYGTAYNDVITGGTGVDYIYGNAGDDTIIGGTGNDHLYGGPGNDTYVFSPGFGNDTVNESLSAGTDTIHLSGIDPADVRLYTDSSGYLHIVDTTNPSYNITVVAGITGANTYESKIGLYVESITFDSTYGTTWDLTGGLNITGDNSGDSLYGTAYNDVITGGTGVDYIYGNAGDDTIIGGTGNDHLYGGPGNDTYVFSPGFGNATVSESLSSGTDTIHLSGIDPADVRLYTDSSGSLHIADTTNPSYNITVLAGITGANYDESKIGLYVESVTFDSSYSTTWDLTGGLTLTGDNVGDLLYGTAYNDVITGGTGADTIYGNAGDDTIIGGTGADNLYGGPGNDTYVFSAGFGNATVHESLSSGTDTIHLTGIDPTDVRLYTDSVGYLHIVDTTNPSYNIAVVAGVVSGTNESTVGNYVESITFDSTYATTWDLTGGLTLTASNSGSDTLYGTQYGDTLICGTGTDTIYATDGNNTLIAGSGVDTMYGGSGNNTFIFSSGFNSDIIHPTKDAGTNSIHLSGIDPGDVRLWTDSNGYVHIADTTNASHNITVYAGVVSGTNESTIGHYISDITFDSGYSTTWDLTGGLTQSLLNSGGTLYGTGHGDDLNGGTGNDTINCLAGNNTVYGGGGTDTVYCGTGADTILFNGATAETGVETIHSWSTSKGDILDIANVISTYDPLTMDIANFVQVSTSGSNTLLKVDTDGSGTSYTQIATISGVTGLNLNDLITDGNLVVHHT